MLTDNQHFLFGISTGIALVATIQYLVSLASSGPPQQAQQSANITKGDIVAISASKSNLLAEESLAHSRPATPGIDRTLSSLSSSVLQNLESHLVVSSSKLQKIVLHLISEMKKGTLECFNFLLLFAFFLVA